jgi:hypothetical protein
MVFSRADEGLRFAIIHFSIVRACKTADSRRIFICEMQFLLKKAMVSERL